MRLSRSATLPTPGWFLVGVQALLLLARCDTVCTSAMIAGQMGAHAVYMRRVIALLVRAHLVEAREGRDGGYRLACPAERITLAAVYRAVREQSGVEGEEPAHTGQAGHDPARQSGMHQALYEVLAETEAQMVSVLERHTLASLAARADTFDKEFPYNFCGHGCP